MSRQDTSRRHLSHHRSSADRYDQTDADKSYARSRRESLHKPSRPSGIVVMPPCDEADGSEDSLSVLSDFTLGSLDDVCNVECDFEELESDAVSLEEGEVLSGDACGASYEQNPRQSNSSFVSTDAISEGVDSESQLASFPSPSKHSPSDHSPEHVVICPRLACDGNSTDSQGSLVTFDLSHDLLQELSSDLFLFSNPLLSSQEQSQGPSCEVVSSSGVASPVLETSDDPHSCCDRSSAAEEDQPLLHQPSVSPQSSPHGESHPACPTLSPQPSLEDPHLLHQPVVSPQSSPCPTLSPQSSLALEGPHLLHQPSVSPLSSPRGESYPSCPTLSPQPSLEGPHLLHQPSVSPQNSPCRESRPACPTLSDPHLDVVTLQSSANFEPHCDEDTSNFITFDPHFDNWFANPMECVSSFGNPRVSSELNTEPSSPLYFSSQGTPYSNSPGSPYSSSQGTSYSCTPEPNSQGTPYSSTPEHNSQETLYPSSPEPSSQGTPYSSTPGTLCASVPTAPEIPNSEAGEMEWKARELTKTVLEKGIAAQAAERRKEQFQESTPGIPMPTTTPATPKSEAGEMEWKARGLTKTVAAEEKFQERVEEPKGEEGMEKEGQLPGEELSEEEELEEGEVTDSGEEEDTGDDSPLVCLDDVTNHIDIMDNELGHQDIAKSRSAGRRSEASRSSSERRTTHRHSPGRLRGRDHRGEERSVLGGRDRALGGRGEEGARRSVLGGRLGVRGEECVKQLVAGRDDLEKHRSRHHHHRSRSPHRAHHGTHHHSRTPDSSSRHQHQHHHTSQRLHPDSRTRTKF